MSLVPPGWMMPRSGSNRLSVLPGFRIHRRVHRRRVLILPRGPSLRLPANGPLVRYRERWPDAGRPGFEAGFTALLRGIATAGWLRPEAFHKERRASTNVGTTARLSSTGAERRLWPAGNRGDPRGAWRAGATAVTRPGRPPWRGTQVTLGRSRTHNAGYVPLAADDAGQQSPRQCRASVTCTSTRAVAAGRTMAFGATSPRESLTALRDPGIHLSGTTPQGR